MSVLIGVGARCVEEMTPECSNEACSDAKRGHARV